MDDARSPATRHEGESREGHARPGDSKVAKQTHAMKPYATVGRPRARGQTGRESVRVRPSVSEWPTALIQRLAERSERVVSDHPLLSDVSIALAVAGAGIVGLSSQDRLDWEQLAFTAALSLPLLLRRRRAMLVFAGLALIAAVQWLIADPQLADAALLVP